LRPASRCLNLAAVEAAEAIGADVEQAACRKGRRGADPILCQFYETCGYQRQRQKAKHADIVFAAHQYLSVPQEVLTKKVGVVVIDESFWRPACRSPSSRSMGSTLNCRRFRCGIIMETGTLTILIILPI
jgi:hypothetical protein